MPPKCLPFFSICVDSFKRRGEGGSRRGCTHNDRRDATIFWGEFEGRVVNPSGSARY